MPLKLLKKKKMGEGKETGFLKTENTQRLIVKHKSALTRGLQPLEALNTLHHLIFAGRHLYCYSDFVSSMGVQSLQPGSCPCETLCHFQPREQFHSLLQAADQPTADVSQSPALCLSRLYQPFPLQPVLEQTWSIHLSSHPGTQCC